ncbi:Glutamate--tRNA ligase [Dirofilaria immitis]
MASHRYSMTQHNTITPESRKISSVPTSSTAESRGAVKKRFFFSTSNIRFWITKPSEKKTSLLKLSNSAADIINHGDQLRYIKEERNTMRRRLHECSLRNSDRNLHLMRTSCISEQQQQQQQQQDITGTNIQLRHMSEPNVNMVNNRNTQERYLQFLSRTNGSLMYQKNNDDDDDHIDDDKIEQNIGSEWEEWMKNQPISVLRLDRTERLVLKIGG